MSEESNNRINTTAYHLEGWTKLITLLSLKQVVLSSCKTHSNMHIIQQTSSQYNKLYKDASHQETNVSQLRTSSCIKIWWLRTDGKMVFNSNMHYLHEAHTFEIDAWVITRTDKHSCKSNTAAGKKT